jgi:hypothetical protein
MPSEFPEVTTDTAGRTVNPRFQLDRLVPERYLRMVAKQTRADA